MKLLKRWYYDRFDHYERSDHMVYVLMVVVCVFVSACFCAVMENSKNMYQTGGVIYDK